jgi:site-specific DNA recombinase
LKIEYVMGQYADTDEGRLQKQIKGAIAEYEKAKIMERSKRGKRGKAKSGYVIVGSRPPYGYKTVSEPHKSWLEIDEEEARIVCLIFLLYVFGENPGTRMSLNGIATYLTKLQIPTRGDKHKHVVKKQGFGVWTYAMIRHIVMNRTYIGEWYYGKTHMIGDGKKATRKATSKCGTGKQVARPQEEWIKVEVPAIINRKTFDLAQQRIEENKTRMGRQPLKKPHLLAKRLRCSRCGYIARAKSYNHRSLRQETVAFRRHRNGASLLSAVQYLAVSDGRRHMGSEVAPGTVSPAQASGKPFTHGTYEVARSRETGIEARLWLSRVTCSSP